jgi:branched-chain amino acid transport system permease protein
MSSLRERLWKLRTPAVLAVFATIVAYELGWLAGGEILALAIFALGYNLLLGFGGELSIGHAAFFGVGAYGTMLSVEFVSTNVYIGIILGVVAATILGAIFAVISLRRRGLYFAMITLALAQIVYYVSLEWNDVTGGTNGLGVPLDYTMPGPVDTLANPMQFFPLGLVLLFLTWFVVWRIINSPFGRVLVAIRENEKRARSLGYNPNRFLTVAFVMSAAISGLAGGLYSILFGFISPNVLYWLFSGEVVLIALLGGIGTLSGPAFGALVFVVLQEGLVEFTPDWRLPFGFIIMLIVLFAPKGVYGTYVEYRETQNLSLSVDEILDRLH